MRSLQLISLGCSKNTVDSEHLLAGLRGHYEIIPESAGEQKVDILLINTCGFIGDAKEESIQTILAAAERKKQGEVGRIVVFGCLSQRYAAELPGLIPEVDSWCGARRLEEVFEALGVTPAEDFRTKRYSDGRKLPYAYLKISEGCDRRCSYCAIPFIRGVHRSVPMETLVKEASSLAADGVKELILIAQDSTYYGLDLYRERALAKLLARLSEIEGIEWLRVHYSYPQDFPEDVLEQMAVNPKICPYMDIPLQHISDRVLSMMHRHIDGAATRALVRKFRGKVPGIVLRTTMIVGHPGESGEDFRELLDFVSQAKFERLGAFKYSEEEGTFGAENYSDDIPDSVKQSRLDELMAVQKDISLEFNRSRVGTLERVLIDAESDGIFVCRSRYESPEVDGEILVKKFPGAAPGDFITVRISGADEYDLIAEPVE
ncbi:MAG: 30S ribosomal protein S12 methylthiotransferase RimO [Bacteroidia bacterium]|nr:30S ribosomal protein S12 methylthiotransferase RimO [Bacteroidia bacterium]